MLKPSRLTIAALALALPLTVTACGNSEGEDKAATSAAPSSAKGGSSAAPSAAPSEAEQTEEESKDVKPEDAPKAEENKDAAPAPAEGDPALADGAAPAVEPLANPFENGANPVQAAPVPPVEDGAPADPAVQKELTTLVSGVYEQQNMRDFMRYIPEHTCQAVLDQQGEDLKGVNYDEIPPIPMNQVVGEAWNQSGFESMNDVQVNGGEASASITVNTPEGQETSLMRFRNEGGRWTFCNAQN